MSFIELQLEEIQHEHPLILTDLQLLFQNYDEYYDDDIDDNDLIRMQNFTCICDRCGLGIDWYHRYYYKCSNKSCNYSLHKFCTEISTALRSPAHPTHILILKKGTSNWRCCDCLMDHQDGMCYHCSRCSYQIDMRCATFQEQKMVHHPGHPHPLISVTTEPVAIMRCFGCGDDHKGDFYHCTTCFNFSINYDCLSLPIKLFREYHRSHMLTLSYSFLDLLYHIQCKICEREVNVRYWLYKCRKCMFYAHLSCVIAQSNEQLLPGEDRVISFRYSSTPCFPVPEESYNILTHPGYIDNFCWPVDDEKCDISHKHPLVLISNNNDDTAAATISDLQLHNPMKGVKLLCNACVRPITSIPFYICTEYSCCNFVLHESCARLPTKLQTILCSPADSDSHILVLRSTSSVLFSCRVCRLPCNGFAYNCESCGDDYWWDVNCAFMPDYIIHEAFPNKGFRYEFPRRHLPHPCAACRFIINKEVDFVCYYAPGDTRVYLHPSCAVRLPKTIRHKLDKHSLKLSYFPVENHKGDYFCEVCEEELNPQNWFYHCSECAQSIHSNCAPLILKSEQGVNSSYDELVYKFLNIKFGGVSNIEDHNHPVSFVAGTNNDGVCTKCGLDLHSKIIFKCLQCKFAIHNYCESSITNSKKDELVHMLDHLDKKHESKVKAAQPQSAIANFYPQRLTRPMVRRLVDA